jgi:hypothetical protein
MPVDTEMPMRFVTLTGVSYVAGNHGTPIGIPNVNTVYRAGVIEVSGQVAGALATYAEVTGYGVSGTATYTGTVPLTTNSVILFAHNTESGTVTEIPSGTIAQTIKLLVEGQ